MKQSYDLVLRYKIGDVVCKDEFPRIFDFTDAYECAEYLDMEGPVTDISITLFGKKSNVKKFATLDEVYQYCISIMR